MGAQRVWCVWDHQHPAVTWPRSLHGPEPHQSCRQHFLISTRRGGPGSSVALWFVFMIQFSAGDGNQPSVLFPRGARLSAAKPRQCCRVTWPWGRGLSPGGLPMPLHRVSQWSRHHRHWLCGGCGSLQGHRLRKALVSCGLLVVLSWVREGSAVLEVPEAARPVAAGSGSPLS